MRTLAGSIVFLLLGAVPGTLLRADDVYLKNGRSFEGVVAEVTDTQVRILLPGGKISLARSAVDRVEKSATSYSDFLGRKEEIMAREKRAGTSAADWLELARWAHAAGFTQGVREAALAAAEIDPRQAGLAALLRPLGYVYEERLDRWIPYGDSMRLHGLVQVDGQWLSPQEAQARASQQLQMQTALAAQSAAVAAGQARDVEMLRAQADMAQGGGGAGAGYQGYDSGSVVGGYYGDVYWPGGYGGIFSVPGLSFGSANGFGGFLRGQEHRRVLSGRGRSPMGFHPPNHGGGVPHAAGAVRR
jgi:hypothetical protein